MRTLRIAGPVLVLAGVSFYTYAAEPAASALPAYRFDMGSESSPVADGYVRVAPGTHYAADRKYGWESREQTAFDVPRPPENPAWKQPANQDVPNDYVIYKEHNDVTRDGVASRSDLEFRVDLPNGIYRVALTLGRLDKPICSLEVLLNGDKVATDFDCKHWQARRRPDLQYGFPRNLRRTVTVKDGVLRVRVHGNDSAFRKRFDLAYDKPPPGSYLLGTYFGGVYRPGQTLGLEGFVSKKKPPRSDVSKWGALPLRSLQVWAWEDIGGPFTENTLCSLEIYPYVERPLEWKDGQLVATSANDALRQGAKLFNSGRWQEAEKAFDAASDLYGRALGYLWLAGRPQYEEELRLLPKALELLNRLAPSRAKDYVFLEDLNGARRMQKALHRFVHRSAELRPYVELIMVTGEVASMQPDDPLYYKSRIYAGRAMYMIIPHRHTYAAGVGRQYIEEVERAGFRDNRFVRWFLHDEWSPGPPEWTFPDYSAKKKGAPRWAAEIYEAYNRELDLGEWWIRNRQAKDGSLGGGWGDDVEILRSLGAFACICHDTSPFLLQGVRNVADGVWNSGSIDRRAGYFAEVDDTEHSGEWTADTLPTMIQLDFGNPVYIERAMKTGKLMRDVWMDYTVKGQRLMRSNYLGATGVGKDGTTNDSRINFRPASPARAVLWYNNLPPLQKIFLEWADAWWAASMSTDRGKPKGIVPQEIGFPSGQIGGERSPSWYEAEQLPGTMNSDWEGMGYLFYLVDLFVTAYEITGDTKYLEPLRLQAEFVQKHLPASVRDSVYVKQGQIHPSLYANLTPGSDAWIATKLATWPAQWEVLQRKLFGAASSGDSDAPRLEKAAEMAVEENEGIRRRWPHVTTECMATDRMYFHGLKNATRMMTGYIDVGQGPLVSYRGLGRDFAAVLLQADAANLRVVLYNLDQKPKDAGLVPWIFKQGDEFELTLGPDDDNDGRPDRVAEKRKFRLESTGQDLPFQIGGRSQLAVEIRRVSQGGKTPLMADLALTAADIQFRGDFAKVDVTVHNIGAAAARHVTVVLLDEQQKEVGRQLIPNVPAAMDLDPQVVRIGLPMELAKAVNRKFTAVVDPDNRLREITKANNRATAACPAKLPPRAIHSSP